MSVPGAPKHSVEFSPDENPVLVYLNKHLKNKTTHRTMVQALQTIVKSCGSPVPIEKFPWHELRFVHIEAIKSRLIESNKPNTVNKILSALRGVLKTAWKMDKIPDKEYRQFEIENEDLTSLPAGRRLTDDEIEVVLAKCSTRDRALIATMYSCGLRRAEASSLLRRHYDSVAHELVVRGKRGKERKMPVPQSWGTVLEAWCNRLPPNAPMFPAGDGETYDPASSKLSPSGISFVIAKYSKMSAKSFTPHDLRRTYASQLLDRGVDISTVRALMGHASISTTAIYDRRGDETRRNAVTVLDRKK